MLSTQAQFDINFSPSPLLKHYPTTMVRATRGSSATWKRFETSVISKGNEIRDVWHRQVRGHSLRLLEPFIGVVGFDYVITLKLQYFS
jgi:hypothetical protein